MDSMVRSLSLKNSHGGVAVVAPGRRLAGSASRYLQPVGGQVEVVHEGHGPHQGVVAAADVEAGRRGRSRSRRTRRRCRGPSSSNECPRPPGPGRPAQMRPLCPPPTTTTSTSPGPAQGWPQVAVDLLGHDRVAHGRSSVHVDVAGRRGPAVAAVGFFGHDRVAHTAAPSTSMSPAGAPRPWSRSACPIAVVELTAAPHPRRRRHRSEITTSDSVPPPVEFGDQFGDLRVVTRRRQPRPR